MNQSKSLNRKKIARLGKSLPEFALATVVVNVNVVEGNPQTCANLRGVW